MKDEAFFVDSKVGFSAAEMGVIMKRIEDRTYIRFQRIEPESGKYWVLMMKEGEDGICYREYISQDKIIANLGKPFEWNWDGDCFGGAYATLGAYSPSILVSSMIDVEGLEDPGIFVHELLHNLGISHTQERPNRDN